MCDCSHCPNRSPEGRRASCCVWFASSSGTRVAPPAPNGRSSPRSSSSAPSSACLPSALNCSDGRRWRFAPFAELTSPLAASQRPAKPQAAISFQPLLQPLIRRLARLGREVVAALGVDRRQLLLRAEQLVDGPCRGHAVLDAADLEVVVAYWGDGEERARGKGRDHLGEVERDLRRVA